MDFKRYRNVPFIIASVAASLNGIYRIIVTGILITCVVIELRKRYKHADD